MTADNISTAADDSNDPNTLDAIAEGVKDDDTINGEDMEIGEQETTEIPNLTKSHLIIRFAGNDKQINVAVLLKSVTKWLFEIDPSMYLETDNPDWKTIKSMNDFPNKEVDFMKCFDPTSNRGGSTAVLISIHLFSTLSIGLMKKNNNSFMQYLKAKRIGIKTSCGGSKHEVLLFGLLGFNPDKTHRDSLTEQLHRQLISISPDLAERKLLEKAKQALPFAGMVPKFEMQPRWINAEAKKYSAKSYGISCAAEHADFLRSFLLRSYFEKSVIGLGKLVQLGGRHNTYLPKAITWHNTFVEECAIVNLLNISKSAMDQKFKRKTTASKEVTTTIRRILLSATEGKAINLYESRDIEQDGRWIVGIDKDKVEHFTVVVATTICKLYENEQILAVNQFEEPPTIDRQRTNRRKSNESGVSGFEEDDNSIQSMHSKAWSTVTGGDSGSTPKKSTNRNGSKIHFVFDPDSTEEFPILPSGSATSHRNDNASLGSTSTVTKSEFEAFQNKFSKELTDNLKACQNSIASSLTGDNTQQAALEEMRAERLAMEKENKEARQQQNEQTQQIMSMFMQFQQMMSSFITAQGPPQAFQQGPIPPFDNTQQQQHQHQHQPPQFQQTPPTEEQTEDQTEQYQHFQPHQRPPTKIYKRPFDFHPQQHQQQRPERPQLLPPGHGWDPYNQRLYSLDKAPHNQQQPTQPTHQQPQQYRPQPEFDYNPPSYSQQQLYDAHHQQIGQKTPPGSVGPTNETPDRKRGKPATSNATRLYYASQEDTANPNHANDQTPTTHNSTSEGAGGAT